MRCPRLRRIGTVSFDLVAFPIEAPIDGTLCFDEATPAGLLVFLCAPGGSHYRATAPYEPAVGLEVEVLGTTYATVDGTPFSLCVTNGSPDAFGALGALSGPGPLARLSLHLRDSAGGVFGDEGLPLDLALEGFDGSEVIPYALVGAELSSSCVATSAWGRGRFPWPAGSPSRERRVAAGSASRTARVSFWSRLSGVLARDMSRSEGSTTGGAQHVALFDLDGTLADYERQMRRDLDAIKAPGEPDYPLHDRSAPKYFGVRLDLIKAQPGWWLRLPRMPFGFHILQLADELGFEIQIMTQGPHNTPSAWMEKVQWCRENISPAVKVTVTEDKSLAYGHVLVDDTPAYVETWLKRNRHGVGIMPGQPANAGFEHPGVVRYDGTNLEEVREALQWVRRAREGS